MGYERDMADVLRLFGAALLALLLSALFCRLVMAFGVMDAPTEARKTQKAPVPTAGGLGFGVAAALAIAFATGWSKDSLLMRTEAGSFAALLVGFYDDRFNLPARAKLILLLAICAALAIFGARVDLLQLWPGVELALPGVIGAAGSILWLLVVINAVNFMDGANGLSMGMGCIASIGMAICCALAGEAMLAVMSAALAGALGGFLIWNVRGKLFAGDAGALFVGAALGAISLALVASRPDWLFVPPMLLLPWLADVILTVAWRTKHRKPLFSAHRDHAYQIAMKAGFRHWQVSLIHAVWALNAAVLAVISAIAGGYAPPLAFLVLLGISSWIHLRVRKSGEKAGLVGAQIP